MSLTPKRPGRNASDGDSTATSTEKGGGKPRRPIFVPEVRERLLRGRKSAKWVRKNFAPEYKHYLGRDPYWFEDDAYRWLESRPGAV